jgi:hypothetical protein
MIPSPLADDKEVRPGNDAGFLLAFHTEDETFRISDKPVLELTRTGYYGEIHASLPSGLEGGVYSFVIEGLTDKDYEKISRVKNPTVRVVKLYLFWRDRLGVADIFGGNLVSVPDFGGSGDSEKHKDDLVAVLRIQSIKRRAGARRYETTITARERIYDLAATRRPCGAEIDAKDTGKAVEELLRRIGKLERDKQFKIHAARRNALMPPAAAPAASDNERRLDTSQTGVSLLQQIAQQLELETNLHGRGMLLIRDGVLHVGPRPIPLDTAKKDPRTLEQKNGLIEVQSLDPLVIDANYDPCKHDNKPAPVRAQFRLTLKGRPDLKPGDLVKFDVPPEDVAPKSDLGSTLLALAGSIGGSVIASFLPGEMANPTVGYVHAVEHKLGRTTSFATTLTVVALKQGEDLSLKNDEKWDGWSQGDPAKSKPQAAEASDETAAGKTIARGVHSILEKLAFTEVGEVREVSPKTNESAPAQSLTVWRGLQSASGANQARKANPVRPSDSPAPTVPYLTPFAWGKCGLVLPRYPGMRVAVTHRRASNLDPIEIGALWQTDHAPDEAKLGDWWLSLPAESPAGNAPKPDSQDAPEDYSGKVTHDLVQADGVRIIEVGEFTIRVRQNRLGKAGKRPDAPGQKGALSIEHGSGAKIVIDKDGNIVIEAKGDLNITAKKVRISCDSMDVS